MKTFLVKKINVNEGTVLSVVVSPDANYIVSGSLDKMIQIWELRTGMLVCTPKGHEFPVLSVAVSPDGNYLVSGSTDKMIKVWKL